MKVELIAVHEIQTREPRDTEVTVHAPGSKFSVEQADADRLLALGAAVLPARADEPELAAGVEPQESDSEPAKTEPAKTTKKDKAKKDLLG